MKDKTMSEEKIIAWTAVFSGALVGVGLNFLLNLLTLSIGLTVFTEKAGGQLTFSFLGFTGFAIAGFIAMFTTGWVAGRLHYMPAKKWGILSGFIAWSLLLIMTIVLITNMLQYKSFHANFTSDPNIVGIRIINDTAMMTESKMRAGSNLVPASVNVNSFPHFITLNAFITFLLFSIGAMSSCLGGYCGTKTINTRKSRA